MHRLRRVLIGLLVIMAAIAAALLARNFSRTNDQLNRANRSPVGQALADYGYEAVERNADNELLSGTQLIRFACARAVCKHDDRLGRLVWTSVDARQVLEVEGQQAHHNVRCIVPSAWRAFSRLNASVQRSLLSAPSRAAVPATGLGFIWSYQGQAWTCRLI